jgi:hypothetical protein
MLNSANSKNSSAAEDYFQNEHTHTYTHLPDKKGEVLLVSWVWQHFHLHHEVKCQEVPQNVPLVLDLGTGQTSPPNPNTHTHTQTPSSFTRTFRTTTIVKNKTLWAAKSFEELLRFSTMSSRESYCKNPFSVAAGKHVELRATTMHSSSRTSSNFC